MKKFIKPVSTGNVLLEKSINFFLNLLELKYD